MKTSYVHKKSITITLDLEVYDDDYYRDLDFNSLLELFFFGSKPIPFLFNAFQGNK